MVGSRIWPIQTKKVGCIVHLRVEMRDTAILSELYRTLAYKKKK